MSKGACIMQIGCVKGIGKDKEKLRWQMKVDRKSIKKDFLMAGR